MKTLNARVRAGRWSALAGAVLALGSFVVAGSASATPDDSVVTPGGTITSPNSVDATTWPNEPDCAAEWHWVIAGMVGTEIGTADVPAFVHVTWSDDSTTDVMLDKITGSTAHYLELSANIPATRTVSSASAVWPDPTVVTAYSAFNLSHGPCGLEDTTTTSDEETTTTSDEETTTTVVDEETTTTVIEETTTSVESETPTTVAGETTTTAVESEPPVDDLPVTGSARSGLMLGGGLVLMVGGALAMVLGRRTRVV
jgi:nitrate reductase alpha subunit